MLPEHMQEELWQEISEYFGSERAELKKAALFLQDAGFATAEIRAVLGGAFTAGRASAEE